MPKYDLEFKLKCIEAYKNKKPYPPHPGLRDVTLKRHVSLWNLLYRERGIEGLSNEIIYKDYSLKDKEKAIKLILKGKSFSEVGRILGMKCHSTVRRWYLDYVKDGYAGLQYKKGINTKTSVIISEPMKKKLTKSEKEELLSLRKRNQILEAENLYLKNLDALLSKREKEEAKAKKQK